MRIRPIRPIFHAYEKDERHEAEEKRMRLLLSLLDDMYLPQSKVQFLKLKTQRRPILEWLRINLSVKNSQHKNYQRAQNLINLLLKTG